MQTSFNNVQWLTVTELAELWKDELKIPKETIERELQMGLYKLEKSCMGEGSWAELQEPLKKPPKEEDLPPKSTLVNREFIEKFCGKQYWALPEFFFTTTTKQPAFPGRPSIMSAIVQELEPLAQQGKLEDTLASQSRKLEDWANKKWPGKQTPTAKSIANGIRTAYNALKVEFR